MTEEELQAAVIKSIGQSPLTVDEALGLLEADSSLLIQEWNMTIGEVNEVHNWAKCESLRLIAQAQMDAGLEIELQQESRTRPTRLTRTGLRQIIREQMWKGRDLGNPDDWQDDPLAHPYNIDEVRWEELARYVAEYVQFNNYTVEAASQQVAEDEDVPLEVVDVAVRDYGLDFEFPEQEGDWDEQGDPMNPDSWAYDPLLDPLNA